MTKKGKRRKKNEGLKKEDEDEERDNISRDKKEMDGETNEKTNITKKLEK